jgi:ribosome-associated heat shock protein Hsp15
MDDGLRIDKWLWATRLFKTRSQAADACRAGKVRMSDSPVKPSRELKTGDVIAVSFPPIVKTVKVVTLSRNRVSAKLVSGLMEDLTSPEEYAKLAIKKELDFEFRQRGFGRPTKRERREIDYLKRMLDR